MSQDQNNPNDLKQPLSAYGSGNQGGNGRQGLGNAFVMSLVRQIARSLGTILVRMLTGGRR